MPIPRAVGALVLAHALMACKKPASVERLPGMEVDELLMAVRDRFVPNPAQARLSVKMSSEPLKIAAPPLAAGLIVDRPGRAYFALMSPLGGPVLTLVSDGKGAAMTNTRDRQYVYAEDAATMLGEASEGSVRLDDLVSLLLGLVPISESLVLERTTVAAGVQLVVSGPGKTVLTTVVNPAQATPVSVSVTDADAATVVTANYEPFELVEDAWMPTEIHIYVPSVDLKLDLRYKSWKMLDEAPDVFELSAPEGYTSMTMEEYVASLEEPPTALEE